MAKETRYLHDVTGAEVPPGNVFELNLGLRFTANEHTFFRTRDYVFTQAESAAVRARVQQFLSDLQALTQGLHTDLTT